MGYEVSPFVLVVPFVGDVVEASGLGITGVLRPLGAAWGACLGIRWCPGYGPTERGGWGSWWADWGYGRERGVVREGDFGESGS